jgi:hypothetical protein
VFAKAEWFPELSSLINLMLPVAATFVVVPYFDTIRWYRLPVMWPVGLHGLVFARMHVFLNVGVISQKAHVPTKFDDKSRDVSSCHMLLKIYIKHSPNSFKGKHQRVLSNS